LSERREGAADYLDFSVSINPFGPKSCVRDALVSSPIDLYPDSEALALKERISEAYGYAKNLILVTAGSTEAIWLIASLFLSEGDSVLVIGPTYGDYAVASEFYGASISELRFPDTLSLLPSQGGGCRDFLRLAAEKVRTLSPALVFLCNPNNPTGEYRDRDAILKLAFACDEAGSILVVDEAYRSFVSGAYDLAEEIPAHNLILLRSMTKDFSLASLRLGYLLASEELVSGMACAAMPWRLSCQAIACGCAALSCLDEYRSDWLRLGELTQGFVGELSELGLGVFPSRTNFFLISLPSRGLIPLLGEKRILLRDCSSFGLSRAARIGTRLSQDNERLIGALRDLKEAGVWDA
jgi:histidinol-phosphate/aromatic aminotransferase/cobyric acid decarboxylase-like protein